MKIKSLDHLVITTRDVRACLHFYVDILGMKYDDRNGRYALYFGENNNQKFNIHTKKAEFLPAAAYPTYGSQSVPAHRCPDPQCRIHICQLHHERP
ncbi:VOC family protein [Porcincola sp. LCP21S3_C12]|uniref:VOC family protein n=1 Tax=Porcincola sp. LCP21S3_C12 TaxID=3438798 RepID=UPI003F99256D